MERRTAGRLAIAALVLAACGLGILAFSEPADPGLAALPALAADDLVRLPDDELLWRVHTDLSRRAGHDWRRLPDCPRHLLVIATLEDGLLRGGGFLSAFLAERDPAMARRPRVSDLAEAYRWLELPEASAVVGDAVRRADAERGQLDAWAAYDRSAPQSGPPGNPFAADDRSFSTAVRTSQRLRIAWVRAHAAETLATSGDPATAGLP